MANEEFYISCHSKNDLQKCIGLFYIGFDKIPDRHYPRIPLLKLTDTILVNGIGKNKIDQNMENFIQKELLKVYDSTEVNIRMDYFKKGKQDARINRGNLIRSANR